MSMNYQKIYDSLINRAKNRQLNSYIEKHHIVPRCIGGDDSVDNLVALTPEEHYVAHQLLHRIYPNNFGLLNATLKMCQGRTNNKLYGWIRRRYSQMRSKMMQGSGNTMHDKRWVSNEHETILVDADVAVELIDSRKYISGKSAKRAVCGHLVRKRCITCEDLKGKRKQIRRAEGAALAKSLFEEFKNSDARSVCEFARLKNTSQPRLTMLWKKYIPEYKQVVTHGKSFKL